MERWIATLDGVKDGLIYCTILHEARGTPLTGQYVALPVELNLIVGRMGPINLSNPIHDDPAFKPYLMVHGRVEQWSREVDIEQSTIQIIGTVDAKNVKIPQQAWPSTGTLIALADSDHLTRLYNEKDERYRLALGHIPNTPEILATIINRNFGRVEDGGYGEARLYAVYGQTGSGKTVFALMLIAGKLCAHPQMGLLMPDTAGDLSDATRHDRGDFHWNYLEVCQAAGIKVEVLNVQDICMTDRATLADLLVFPFHRHIGNMRDDIAYRLGELVSEEIFGEKDVTIAELTSERVLDAVGVHIGSCYAGGGNTQKAKLQEVAQLQTQPARRRAFERDFERVRQFFDGRERMGDLVQSILEHGRKVVIRMDSRYLREKEQVYVMRELMEHLTQHAQRRYTQGQQNNALVVLDEGTRWVPEARVDDTNETRSVVNRAYRETRKYGVGWMVIAQRIAEVAKTVLTQSQMVWFGRGLGSGTDRRHLEEVLLKEGLETYDRLELQGGFFWVGKGQENNLGTEGNFTTVHPFGGDATAALIAANPAIFRRRH